jgi:multimeric flavodoxin WrbA
MKRVRQGQIAGPLGREEFRARYLEAFKDPAFRPEWKAIARIEAIAWDSYTSNRKAPLRSKAGAGYFDPDYELSDEWRAARNAVEEADRRSRLAATRSRVLVISGSDRNDGTCPGEMSKTFRLSRLAVNTLEQAHFEADELDLSRMTSEPGRRIHPCKGCVSTAMPLCHWPCSCYPNHAVGQTNDWMNEIYERWAAAHGVVILTPVYWYQAPSALKLMIDRLVCADGGNPDPTSTHGKNPEEAKELELAGWPYPKHLAGRAYGLVVHGDTGGAESVRRALSDWLDTMGLIDAGLPAQIDRYIGYYKPYATSHDELDRDDEIQEEVRNVARAVVRTVEKIRAGRGPATDSSIKSPRPK